MRDQGREDKAVGLSMSCRSPLSLRAPGPSRLEIRNLSFEDLDKGAEEFLVVKVKAEEVVAS